MTGRLVTCPACGETVRRYELPYGPIGNDTCGPCLIPVPSTPRSDGS